MLQEMLGPLQSTVADLGSAMVPLQDSVAGLADKVSWLHGSFQDLDDKVDWLRENSVMQASAKYGEEGEAGISSGGEELLEEEQEGTRDESTIHLRRRRRSGAAWSFTAQASSDCPPWMATPGPRRQLAQTRRLATQDLPA